MPKADVYDIIVDGKLMYSDLQTVFLMVNNGKFAGGKMLLNPYGMINDGLFETLFLTKKKGLFNIMKIFDGVKKGGFHAYSSEIDFVRSRTVKIVNKNL